MPEGRPFPPCGFRNPLTFFAVLFLAPSFVCGLLHSCELSGVSWHSYDASPRCRRGLARVLAGRDRRPIHFPRFGALFFSTRFFAFSPGGWTVFVFYRTGQRFPTISFHGFVASLARLYLPHELTVQPAVVLLFPAFFCRTSFSGCPPWCAAFFSATRWSRHILFLGALSHCSGRLFPRRRCRAGGVVRDLLLVFSAFFWTLFLRGSVPRFGSQAAFSLYGPA